MDNAIRLSYVARTYIPSNKAHAVQIAQMCSAFSENNITTKLYCLSDSQMDPFEYYGLQNTFAVYSKFTPVKNVVTSLQFLNKVARDIKISYKPDIIFSRKMYDLLYLSGTGGSLILESHTPPTSFASIVMHKMLFRKKNFNRLVVISQALKEEFLRLYKNVLTGKIVVAHDGANLHDKLSNAETTIEWNRRDNVLQIGYIGSLYKGKGIESILQLAQELSQFDFHIVGGKPEDIQKCKAIYNGKNINYHGYIPHGSVGSYFQYFDVMLAPYSNRVVGSSGKHDLTNWMSPLKLFEYMAASKAIICSDLPVLREILEDKKTAIFAKPDDLTSWKKALLFLAANPDVRKHLGVNASQVFEDHFTWKARAKHILENVN